jgi:hypothetical protein
MKTQELNMNATKYAFGNDEIHEDREHEDWECRASDIQTWINETGMEEIKERLPADLAEKLGAVMFEIYDRLESAELGLMHEAPELHAILRTI